MRDPLDQFAERLIRNGEVKEFIQGLMEKGVSPLDIRSYTQEEPPKPPTYRTLDEHLRRRCVDKRQLQARDQLLFLVQHGGGLWHYDDGLQRFYYAQAKPESLTSYVGVEHISCALPGTKPITVPA